MRQLYQRFIEVDPPANVPRGCVPMWSWPVELREGWTMLTLLYRPLMAPNAPRFVPTTQVLLVSPKGNADLWAVTAANYPSPVIFFANLREHLLGFDLTNPKKIYACLRDGKHLWSLETPIRLDNLIAPASFFEAGQNLYWMTAANVQMSADVSDGAPKDLREYGPSPDPPTEFHHPHTHLLKNSIYILDFDPMGRITRYEVSG